MAKKRGRPARSPEGAAKAISVRMAPMTRLGLQILANDNNSSVAQAVEFALWETFDKHTLTTGKKIADILSDIPPNASDRVRQLVLYGISPHLTDFEYRAMAIVVWTSLQMQAIERKYASDHNARHVQRVLLFEWFEKYWDIFTNLASKRWNALKSWDLKAELDHALEESSGDLLASEPDAKVKRA